MSVSEQPVGAEIAGYRIESVIGRGGMAVVYRAEDTRLGRKVALKLLTPSLSDQVQFQQRFIQESRLAASLDHPNIIPIYEAGNADGLLFIAMRFVVGSDLKVALSGGKRLTPARTLRLCEQVGDALDAAHELGLVHRDVKPGNVLLTSFHDQVDHVYLTDFGLTKRASSLTGGLTGTGHFLGTIDYVAPEQIAGKPVDARTDIYALGCVLYECLTGRVPFARDDDAATLWAHLVDLPPSVTAIRDDVAPAVDEVITRAMAKSPADRYGSCDEFVTELKGALELPAPVRGRIGGGVDTDTAPPRGRGSSAEDRLTRAPVEHPSFPPGSFPPGTPPPGIPRISDDDQRAGAASESAAPGQPWVGEDLDTDTEGDADADADRYEDGDLYQDGDGADYLDEDGRARSFARAYRWPLLIAVAIVAALIATGLVWMRPSGKAPAAKLTGQYHSAAQFQSLVGPFTVGLPTGWSAFDDEPGTDAMLTQRAPIANLFFNTSGSGGSWAQVADLISANPAQAAGVWVYASRVAPDPSSAQSLQNAVTGNLPASPAFDAGSQPRTIGGMQADELSGSLVDPAAVSTSLRFVMDLVRYKTPALTSSVWVMFFAPPTQFAAQQALFDQIRASITFN